MGVHFIVYVIVAFVSLVTAYAVGMPAREPAQERHAIDTTDGEPEKELTDSH